ncbi:T9SS type A sorting domain-containing protein [Chitinophaga nivalis]|uniref:T9SS type A sorting domain-containing protein n=1 Tax=Chitinophaga nivalis TaxID=2991709 RepID=A0ABT3IQV5_9BACT|nr:T9SS type A sorting domain-containing protein [Chitinophaga nivalis]MCW3463964.1 T9SS type A sorting domain-containing protein [Chitinophaga nivalis]MCW3486346.1 T9SS type A sorting domain-containing protein [Chitinophaga nivalis]
MKKLYLLLLFLFSSASLLKGQVLVTASSGSSGITYPTLGAAFQAINNGEHKGVVNVLINSSIVEPATARLNASGGLSDYTQVNIQPTATVMISGAVAGPLIELNGTHNVKIDGRIGGTGDSRSLTIRNTAAATSGTNVSVLRLANGAQDNNISWVTGQAASLPGPASKFTAAIIIIGGANNTAGNSFNIIDNNDIGPIPGKEFSQGLLLTSPATIPNMYNQISNNLIHDIVSANTATMMTGSVFLESGNEFTSITGNSFYLTKPYLGSFSAIAQQFIYVLQGGGHVITGNYMGGTAPFAGGTPATYTGYLAKFNAIVINNLTPHEPVTIDDNVITNIQVPAATNLSEFQGIKVNANRAYIGTILGNTIGSLTDTGAISINYTDSVSRAKIGGIESTWNNQGAVTTIQHNRIGGILVTGARASGVTLFGIHSAVPQLELSDNVIGGDLPNSMRLQVVNGTINGISLQHTAPITTVGYPPNQFVLQRNLVRHLYNNGRGLVEVNGIACTQLAKLDNTAFNTFIDNRIQQLHATNIDAANSNVSGIFVYPPANDSTSYINSRISNNEISDLYTKSRISTATVAGIRVTAPFNVSQAIDSNRIYQLECAGGNPNSFASTALQGITLLSTGKPGASISRNQIYQLRSTALDISPAYISGINCFQTISGNIVIAANRLYDFQKTNGGTGVVAGAILRGSTGKGNFILQNNMFSFSAADLSVYGIWNSQDATGIELYYNTVAISGNATGSNASAAFHRLSGVSTPTSLLNNIFHNTRQGGTGGHYVLINANATPASGWDVSNFNDLYSTAAAPVLWGTTAQDLATYRLTSGKDGCSKSVAVDFVQPATGDLHLQNTTVNHTLGGTPIPNITEDFDGHTRQANPAMGADEISITLPQPKIVALSDSTTCEGRTVSLRSTLATNNQWYLNDTLIAGATAQTYTATRTGLYVVKYSDGCNTVASIPKRVTIIPRPVITRIADSLYSSGTGTTQWLLNNTVIPGATTYRFKPTQNGSYTVRITGPGGCTLISDPFVISDLASLRSIDNSSSAGVATSDAKQSTQVTGVRLYPNPATTSLYVQIGNHNGPVLLQVYDLQGRKLQEQKATATAGGALHLDIQRLQAGTYLLSIQRAGTTVTQWFTRMQ